MMDCLYKFRNIDKHAIDILVNRRLYFSSWEILNDPHEAQMLVRTPGLHYHMNPRRLKEREISVECPDARVCALSTTWASNLLWSHYAAGQTGIAIGLKLPEELTGFEILRVEYDDSVPDVKLPVDKDAVLKALKHKSKEWTYEQEIRLVSFDPMRRYLHGITITEVIFGLRSTNEDIDLIKSITKSYSVELSIICRKPGYYQLNRSVI